MKKILIILLLFWLILPAPLVLAQSNLGATPGAEKAKPKEEVRVQNQQEVMARLKERAFQEINRRLDSLNKLVERINALKRLTTEQKTTLANQIQTEINNLQTLKNKITADADVATLKADAQSIIKAYRIYALFMPKIHLLAACDTALDLLDTKIKDITVRIQAKISEAKTSGKDVAILEASLSVAQTKTANLKSQIQTLQSTVMALTAEGYPNNKTNLQNARTTLQAIHRDIQSLRQDLTRIIQGLRGLKVKPSPANFIPSATPASTGNEPG